MAVSTSISTSTSTSSSASSSSVSTSLPTTRASVSAEPVRLAQQIAEAEAAVRDPATPPAELVRQGRLQQLLYRTLARHPQWHDDVLSRVPPALRRTATANLTAAVEIAALNPPPKPQLPNWRIVPPDPAEELLAHYRAAEEATGVSWTYLAAIHLVETRMGRLRGVSTAGARGPMQFLPSTWAQYGAGGDIDSNRDAIPAAARLLRSRGAPANMDRALFAYNPSRHYVRAISAYAAQMAADELAYRGYYQWQVFYGDRLMPEGYPDVPAVQVPSVISAGGVPGG